MAWDEKPVGLSVPWANLGPPPLVGPVRASMSEGDDDDVDIEAYELDFFGEPCGGDIAPEGEAEAEEEPRTDAVEAAELSVM